MSRTRALLLVLASILAVVLAGAGMKSTGPARAGGAAAADDGAARTAADAVEMPRADGPNVVLIVADDLDKSLMPYLPNVQRLIGDAGAELTNFYVEQSTCCTSRATILSGRYAHNHGVIANTWPKGGFVRWQLNGEAHSLATWLEAAGYRNALMGKYFNEYPFPARLVRDWGSRADLRRYQAPGWHNWMVPVQGDAYGQSGYRLNTNHHLDTELRTEYLDEVLGRHAVTLVGGAGGFDFAGGGSFLYYAPYSPHAPYPYPEEYADDFTTVRYPRTPDFNEADVSDKFGVTRVRPRLTWAQQREIDEAFRDRIRSVQVLDRNVGNLVAALEDEGALDETYIIFTTDNGYIMGGHRREIGKYNHFQATVNVPFYVRGPGIAPGTTIDDPAGNVDIAPTVADMAGAAAPQDLDGISLLPRLTGGPELSRRHLLLGRDLIPTNRAAASPLEEKPEDSVLSARASRLNDFVGVVGERFKLIRYTHLGREELYDLERDPYELNNLLADGRASYAAMSAKDQAVVRELRKALEVLVDCQGVECRL